MQFIKSLSTVAVLTAFTLSAVPACAQLRVTDPSPATHHADPSDVPSRHGILHVSRPLQQTEGGMHAHALGAASTVPMWQSKDGNYSFQMVGTDPNTTNTTTTIPTPIIPVVVTFASDNSTFDPTVAGACSAQAPTNLLLASPIFGNAPYTVGGTSIGTTQYVDFFQRASFWKTVSASPNYHVLLAPTVQPAIKITVPAASGRTIAAVCGRLGEMDINYFDSLLATQFPQLTATVTPGTFPIFLLYNVVMYDTKVTNCCILGYHSAFNSSSFGGAVQTYGVSEFDTSGDFGSGNKDVATLSHEVGEWMDDPTGNNPTPAWGHTGQVSGCQGNLEVGDPLSGTIQTVTMSNAYTYHVQEMAFKSWFYRDTPSTGVNGWYSSNGTFKTPAAACTGSTTTLSITPTSLSPGTTATVSVTVKPASGSGTPTGTVTLVSSAANATLATYTLSNGAATGSLVPPAGAYTITANYGGDTNFQASSSAAVSMTVGSPSVTLAPVAVSFGNQNVGSASSAQTVVLSNKGTAALKITSIAITGASPSDFSQTNNCSASMPVNTTCNILVLFKPTAGGARTAAITITDSATTPTQIVPLSGTGVAVPTAPKAVLSAASSAFGTANTGTTATRSVTLSNTGTASLTGIAVSVAGANASEFSQTNNCGSTLAINATCTISVSYKPLTVAISKVATVSIADNAVPSPQTVALTGAALAPAPVISGTTPSSVKAGSSSVITVSGNNFQKGVTATFTASRSTTVNASLVYIDQGRVAVTVVPGVTATGAGILTLSNPDSQKVAVTVQVVK